ncbi:MAG: fibronectin type III domain-containing protein, partial [Chloroflexota bacterium]
SATGSTVNLNWSGSAAPGWNLKGYEVAYKEQSSSSWTTLQSKTSSNTSGSFPGQVGKLYDIRVRAWQTKSEPYNSDIDMPGVWREATVVVGEAVVGQVINNFGTGVSGVTVAISGTATSTTSDSSGNYILPTGSAGTFEIVASDSGGMTAPPAKSVTVPANSAVTLNISLRPADDAIKDYDFEMGNLATSWHTAGGSPSLSSTSHTGSWALQLDSSDMLTQTQTVTNMRRPLLSFWYKTDAGTTLTAQFLGESGSIIQTKILPEATAWTYITVESGLGENYTGSVGVKLSHTSGTNGFIDEVSIAAGPLTTYIPIVLKN